MADFFKGVTDQYGRAIEKKLLTSEIAGPSITGVRSPITGYPGDGLNPQRLASILREADQGDPVRYLELAETIEERDPHYLGIMGTRKRSVSQLEVTVEPASDAPEHESHAQTVRDWLDRDELQFELFDMLDAIGKGYSFTEIIWDTSQGQWQPKRLEWRDPRWFRFLRNDLTTPVMIGDGGEDIELPAFKFIHAVMKAKSGLPLRSGIARVASWAWMFKAFTARDWAIFTQTYGQPLRVGKYHTGATREERDTLFRAVANIAGDCAAIIPETMLIEFVEAKSVGSSMDLYERRSDWLDRQLSKLVLGQTATTDAVTGGLGSGKEHREVQEDIERADAKSLSAIVNAGLVVPWIMLEFGPQNAYPRLKIGRAEDTDVKLTVESVRSLVPFGLKVGQKQMRDLIGLGAPADDDELLATASAAEPHADDNPPPPKGKAKERQALQHERTAAAMLPNELIGQAAQALAMPAISELVERVRGVVASAGSLDQAEAALQRAAAAGLAPPDLEAAMRQAMLLAWLSGEAAEADQGDAETALQFDPSQARVPDGQRNGGQWTDDPTWTGRGTAKPRAAAGNDLDAFLASTRSQHAHVGLAAADRPNAIFPVTDNLAVPLRRIDQLAQRAGLEPPALFNLVAGSQADFSDAAIVAVLERHNGALRARR